MSTPLTFDPSEFGAIGSGQTHPLRWNFSDIKEAQQTYPAAISLEDERDWIGIQGALNAARDYVRATLARGNAPAIHRTGGAYAPIVFIPPGRYLINRPLSVYPHVTVKGADWGHSQLQLTSWVENYDPMTCNKQGVMWCGSGSKSSAVLWLRGDEEWPLGTGQKVAGMVATICNLGIKCHEGAAIFIGSNQNQLSIRDCWINGWGAGPDGLGIIANNPTSSTQITNLFLHNNMIEGCRAAIVMDRVVIGSIDHNQIESCGSGIYAGSGEALSIDDNKLTCSIPAKPFENGIWLGCGVSCSISNNTIKDVTLSGIKILGKDCSVANNRIRLIKSGASGIHIVTQANQFGGDVTVLGGRSGPYCLDGNIAAGSLTPLWLDKTQAEPEILIV